MQVKIPAREVQEHRLGIEVAYACGKGRSAGVAEHCRTTIVGAHRGSIIINDAVDVRASADTPAPVIRPGRCRLDPIADDRAVIKGADGRATAAKRSRVHVQAATVKDATTMRAAAIGARGIPGQVTPEKC